jgi:transcriptional regulator with XRE-family HTH domain
MILLRRVIGDALRARRQAQHRTLREVSMAANVSLGYLSEIERGQKEASSELLAAVCDALGARLSELLHEISSTVASTEQGEERPTLPEQRGAAPTAERGPQSRALVPAEREHRALVAAERQPNALAGIATEAQPAEAADQLEPVAVDGLEPLDGLEPIEGLESIQELELEPVEGLEPVQELEPVEGLEPAEGLDPVARVGTAERRSAGAVAQASLTMMVDGDVAVTVRQDTPLSATLRARTIRRDVLSTV